MQKNRLLIYGSISQWEVTNLNNEFNDEPYSIVQYAGAASIGGFSEVVNLIFDDFSPIGCTRDFIITSFSVYIYNKVKPVIISLARKGKKIRNFTVIKQYKKIDGGIIFLKFSAKYDKFELLITKMENTIGIDFLESIESGKNITFTLQITNDIEITIT